jgi:hypothetical protein
VYFADKIAECRLQLRLAGGGKWIRTRCTVRHVQLFSNTGSDHQPGQRHAADRAGRLSSCNACLGRRFIRSRMWETVCDAVLRLLTVLQTVSSRQLWAEIEGLVVVGWRQNSLESALSFGIAAAPSAHPQGTGLAARLSCKLAPDGKGCHLPEKIPRFRRTCRPADSTVLAGLCLGMSSGCGAGDVFEPLPEWLPL